MAKDTVKKAGSKRRCGKKNPILIPGVHRFGRSKFYHKKGLWAKRNIVNPKKVQEKKSPLFIEKKIGGDKNGGKRLVQVKKSKRYHPTAVGKKRVHVKRPDVIVKTRLRGSLKPGIICILLAGRHAGKRVVFMKQLKSGLLLVNGPFKINGVPLRRVNQRYVIATSTKIDLSKVKIPDNLNDDYFKRDKKADRKTRKEQQGDIFAAPKEKYVVNDTRKKDQVDVDKLVLGVVKANPEKKMLLKYLGSSFGLGSGQFPHKMKF
jgi:large subunit ribosomal protein L6e